MQPFGGCRTRMAAFSAAMARRASIEGPIAGQVGEDRAIVIAVGRRDVTAPALGLQVVLAHQSADLLVVDDDAMMAEFGTDAPVAVSLELVADRPHAADNLGVVVNHKKIR